MSAAPQNPLLHVLEIVHASPGLSLNAVRERAGLGWGSMYQRVDRLKAAGLVRLEQDGRRRLVFPVEAPDAEACQQLAARASLDRPNRDTLRRLARTLLAHPGIGALRLARRVGIPPRSAYLHVKQLVAAGLVEREGPLCRSTLRPTPRLRLLLGETCKEESTLQPPHGARNLESSEAPGPSPL